MLVFVLPLLTELNCPVVDAWATAVHFFVLFVVRWLWSAAAAAVAASTATAAAAAAAAATSAAAASGSWAVALFIAVFVVCVVTSGGRHRCQLVDELADLAVFGSHLFIARLVPRVHLGYDLYYFLV